MVNSLKNRLSSVFRLCPEIKLVYLFGSKASGKAGPLSDYDFAIYLDEKRPERAYDIKLGLMDKLGRLLKTDKVDVVTINSPLSPELKYGIITEGKLIFERKPFKVLLEPKILNEYFDFRHMLLRHRLTKA